MTPDAMTIPTIHGAEHDLAVIREVRDRILAGDWTQGAYSDPMGHHCLSWHLSERVDDFESRMQLYRAVLEVADSWTVAAWNDTHTQAEVIALLDDVEDSLLGELGVLR